MASIKVKFRKSTVEGRTGTVYYQICHASECRQVTTRMRIYPEDWDKEHDEIRISDDIDWERKLQNYRQKINRDIRQFRNIERDFGVRGINYTCTDIVKFLHSEKEEIKVLRYMEECIERLKRIRHFGTARNYRSALKSFSGFLSGSDIPFALMNTGLIMEYNDYLEERGITKNSVSFYMRIWRAVYNRAVKERIVEQAYPFLEVYTGIDHTRKRAVAEDVLIKLLKLDLRNCADLELSRDLFVFSYCTRGMAFVDIAFLKKTNIEGDKIVYKRRKTRQLLTIKIEPCIRYLIEKYKKNTLDSVYIFPILDAKSEYELYNQYLTALSLYNIKLKKLSRMVGIDIPLSSHISRHTWATTAHNHHIPISIISAAMGHTSEKTTEIYLASLENSVVDNVNCEILKMLNKYFSF